jgi:N-acetylmuramoyl-L-alanine amidase
MNSLLPIIAAPSPNHGSRKGMPVSMLVLHYTGMETGEAAMARLRDPAAIVSAHYLVEEDGRIFQLVDEARRANHAGRSCWRHWRDVNSASIGVEIVNAGHAYGLPPFPEAQMASVEALCLDILRRHPTIAARNVVGHSDIAPWRKDDPGERFDWKRLERAGVAVPTPDVSWREGPALSWGDSGPEVLLLQRQLIRVGYCLPQTGAFDLETAATLVAFQRRFRQDLVDGIADQQCQAILAALAQWLGA